MFLSEIWIYPVKSLRGIRVKEARVEERGLQFDRRWMIVDENGKFLTQRVNADMALIDVSIDSENLILSHQSNKNDSIHIPFHPGHREPVQVKVWNDWVTAFTVSEKADRWLSFYLKKNVRIVEMLDSSERKMHSEKAVNGESVSFADDFPYLLISEASLEDLNNKLATPVDMKRFRPNFVITATEAYAEDSWKTVQIGETSFHASTQCERCIMVNIDPETGQKGTDPLKTLGGYRRIDKKIFFGRNLISTRHGIIREGDEILVM